MSGLLACPPGIMEDSSFNPMFFFGFHREIKEKPSVPSSDVQKGIFFGLLKDSLVKTALDAFRTVSEKPMGLLEDYLGALGPQRVFARFLWDSLRILNAFLGIP